MLAEIVSILNLKGGVGKTTTAINLGKALSLKHKKVLVIDSDPQANLTEGLGIRNFQESLFHCYKFGKPLSAVVLNEYFHVVPAELNLATIENEVDGNINRYYMLSEALEPMRRKYDFILIDCPPSLGVYTINAITASTRYLITAQAARYSITGLGSVKDLIETQIRKRLNPKIQSLGILVTFMAKTIATDISMEELTEGYASELMETKIRQTTKLAESSLAGEDIFTYAPGSNGAEDYMALAEEVLRKVK